MNIKLFIISSILLFISIAYVANPDYMLKFGQRWKFTSVLETSSEAIYICRFFGTAGIVISSLLIIYSVFFSNINTLLGFSDGILDHFCLNIGSFA